MQKQDNRYTAGLIDGEGSITLSPHSTPYRAPTVEMSSTSKELLDFLKQEYGGSISKHKIYSPKHRQSWHWAVRYQNALAMMKKIFPYLKENKKKKRTKFILDNYNKVTLRNGRYNKNQVREKLKFEKDFFKVGG